MLKNSRNVFCTVLAAALLAAGSAWGSDAPLECTTDGAQNWKVEVIGPLAVTCPGGGECTEIDYKVTPLKGKSADHVAVLTEHDMEIVVPGTSNIYAPCVGDSVTTIGIHDCSSRAVRLNSNVQKAGAFDLVVEGNQALRGKSIVVKKGSVRERCRIASLGQDGFNPNAQRTTSQELNFKGCTVTIPTDPVTGEGGEATISGTKCKFVANGARVNTGQLIIDGTNVGAMTFGEGYISSGSNSCTTKVVQNRLYSWCTCARFCSNNASRACDANNDCVSPGVCLGTGDPTPPCD